MGVEQSGLGRQRQSCGDQAIVQEIFRRAMFEELSKMVDENAGMTSAQIEHAWDPEDCSPAFRVLCDHVTARRVPSMMTTDCIRGKKGYIVGRHVWEIQWDRTERGRFAVVGVATPQAPLRCVGYGPLVGSTSESWGWNLSDKQLMHDGMQGTYPPSCPGLLVPDSIYVILNMIDRTLSFATKDINLGVAFKNLPQQRNRPLCSIVSAMFNNCDVKMMYIGSGDEFLARIRPLIRPAQPQATKPVNAQSPRKPSGQTRSEETIEGSSSYKFHHTCGTNIVIMCGGKEAKRIDALDNHNNGIVLSSTPLKDNELFEVRLDNKVNRWYGTAGIGATENSPDKFNFPDCMINCREKTTFMWFGDKIMNNGSDMITVSKKMDDVRVGDRVGVMRKSDNSLHFYLNGVNIGKKVQTIPAVLYGVVDVFGQAEKVTLTGGSTVTQTSDQDHAVSDTNDPVTVKVRMNNAIELLKDSGRDILERIAAVSRYIAEPYTETSDRKMRQNYGDHLAEIGGAIELTKLLKRLIDLGSETKEGWIGMQVVRTAFWNYSDASLKMGKAVGRSGVLSVMLRDLDTYGPSESTNEKRSFLVLSAMNILHNCAKATENRQVFRDLRAVERLVPFMKTGRMDIVVVAILTLSYITDEEQRDMLEADSKVIGYLIGMLRNAVDKPDLRGQIGTSTWSALEIAVGLGNIATNDTNKERMVDQGAIALFVDLMNKDGDMEKECAANAVWALAKASSGREMINRSPKAVDTLRKLLRCGAQSVQEAAKRVLLELRQTETLGTPTQTRVEKRTNCDYQRVCKTYKDSLNLGVVFFDTKFDKCFCTECHASRGEKLYYTRGKPAKDYGIPVGWCRFGLKVPHRAEHLDVFNKWHVAFHGTRAVSIQSILNCGDLLIPGDVALGGRQMLEEKGHFNDDRKPTGFDTKQIFVSPSVRYSGNNIYAMAESFQDSVTKKRHEAKVVLQVCIRPESYKVGPQTINAAAEIDPKISNQEIEWFTKERGSIIIYGLLIKMAEIKAE